MDPFKVEKRYKKPKNPDEIKATILSYYSESKSLRDRLEIQWSNNQKIVKGIPIHKEKLYSTIKKRQKIKFRKVWSSTIRLLASLYQAFLMDDNKFKIRGFDDVMDWMKASVLDTMTKFRLQWLFRRRDGFTKFIWAFMDCISPGTGIVKVHWKYNEEMNIDEPCMTNYPLEHVCLDWSAATPSDMRYAILENYLTKNQMEEMGYNNIKECTPVTLPTSQLRETRYYNEVDPLRDHKETSAYSNGTVGSSYPQDALGTKIEDQVKLRYRVLECFYRKNGQIYFCVLNPGDGEASVYLIDPIESPYGKDLYPIAVGSLLLEAHKLVPESLVQPLAGPQEDLNMTMNLRKENQLLAMMGGWSIDKFAGVDTQSLNNLRPGFIVRRNPGQGAIEQLRLPDVTQTSYMETNADQVMIDEMSGVNDTKRGDTTSDKTGVAQINLQEANAKEGLFTAIVGNTLFKQVIYLLAYQIQKFETDERIFRIANAALRKDKGEQVSDIYDLNFDMDVEVSVGLNEVSRQSLLQKQFMMIDRSLQANNSTMLMMKTGASIQNPVLVNVAEMIMDTAPQLGIKNMKKYLVPIQPPQGEPGKGGKEGQAAEGQNVPQPNAKEAQYQDLMRQMQQR